jgi:large subunit ribosomal protein L10
MRTEKQSITREYRQRLDGSPFFIMVDYKGLNTTQFSDLRQLLADAGAEVHVVKTSLFKLAAKEAGIEDLGEGLEGQMAVVTGQQDVSPAAKVLKKFQAKFDKPKIRLGFLNQERLEAKQVEWVADLPSLDALRGQLLAAINGPATKLAQVLNTPGTQLARVLQARSEQNPS